jgi:hypothetical protein
MGVYMSNTKLETVLTCPLGSTCEEIKDNKIHRCIWYTTINGEELDPKTGSVIKKDKSACAIEWLPLLQIEMSKTNRGQTTALESFRNETVKRQDDMINEVKTNNKLNLLKTLENASQDIKQIKTIDSDIISE